MTAAGRGTILFTGATASLRGAAGMASFAVGKFGLRALAQSMARELVRSAAPAPPSRLCSTRARLQGPKGIHVAHVVVDGAVDLPLMRKHLKQRLATAAPRGSGEQDVERALAERVLSPDAVADVYWWVHAQHPSAWTFELDLRPAREPMANL